MTRLRSLLAVAALALVFAAGSPSARADGYPVGPGPGCPTGYGQGYPQGNTQHGPPQTLAQAIHTPANGQRFAQFFQNIHHKNLPAFQAAPWYNYWPYDGHFLTPAPIGGQFYGPAMTGNFPVNPYFPGPVNPGYGPMPGGPAPGFPSGVSPTGGR
jgi:hypothetical protein